MAFCLQHLINKKPLGLWLYELSKALYLNHCEIPLPGNLNWYAYNGVNTDEKNQTVKGSTSQNKKMNNNWLPFNITEGML